VRGGLRCRVRKGGVPFDQIAEEASSFAIIDNIAEAYLRADVRERAIWNEAVFAGIWVGDREIMRTDYRDLFASILSDTSSNWVSW
jgi:hypothetical protein